MNPEEIKVNFNHLQDGGASLQATMRRIRAQLEELDKDVKPIQTSWVAEGSAAGALYQIHRQKLGAHIDNLAAIINDFGVKTVDAADFQRLVEHTVANSFHG